MDARNKFRGNNPKLSQEINRKKMVLMPPYNISHNNRDPENPLTMSVTSRETRVGHLQGPAILHLGFHKENLFLSQTLYIILTANVPPPRPFSKHICRRHQRNHISSQNHKKNIMKRTMNKFQIIPIAIKNPPPITREDIMPYSNSGKILGLINSK